MLKNLGCIRIPVSATYMPIEYECILVLLLEKVHWNATQSRSSYFAKSIYRMDV